MVKELFGSRNKQFVRNTCAVQKGYSVFSLSGIKAGLFSEAGVAGASQRNMLKAVLLSIPTGGVATSAHTAIRPEAAPPGDQTMVNLFAFQFLPSHIVSIVVGLAIESGGFLQICVLSVFHIHRIVPRSPFYV